MVQIELDNGTVITGLYINGNNYVGKSKIDTSLFPDIIEHMTVYDGEETTEYFNQALTQQMFFNDEYYICFHQISDAELEKMKLQKENTLLKAQIGALETNQTFLEDCLIEMAQTVYA